MCLFINLVRELFDLRFGMLEEALQLLRLALFRPQRITALLKLCASFSDSIHCQAE